MEIGSMDTGLTHLGGSTQPPPVRKAARFTNPTFEDTEDTTTEGTVEILPPPDIIEGALKKQLDSLKLLVHSTHASTFERHCAGVPLPKELLDSVDIAWILAPPPRRGGGRTSTPGGFTNSMMTDDGGEHFPPADGTGPLRLPSRGSQRPGTQSSFSSSRPQSRSRGRKGKRNLDNVFEHRHEETIIDSPRSVVVLMKSGYSSDTLKQGADPNNEKRRRRIIANLRSEYNALCELVSQHCVVDYLRTVKGGIHDTAAAYLSPATSVQRDRSPEVSPERARPLSRETAGTLTSSVRAAHGQDTHGEGTSLLGLREETLRSPSPTKHFRKVKTKNLSRVMQHRDLLTADWGLRQQKLANDTYAMERIDELKATMHKAKQPLIPKATATTPTASAQPTQVMQSPSQTPPPLNVSAGSGSGVSPGSRSLVPPSQQGDLSGLRGLSEEEKLRRRQKVVDMRKHKKELAERRRAEIDAKMTRKEQIVAEAEERRAQRRHEMTLAQQAKARQVKEVNDRMKRNEAYSQLQLVRRMEEQAERGINRANEVERERQTIQDEYRQRNCLQYETRQFLTASGTKMDKILFKQEAFARRSAFDVVSGSGGRAIAQRRLKEESRDLLKHVLRKEDKLIRMWKKVDGV